ncbi:MAG: DegV family protein, partial [Clostridia bacterium]
GSGTYASGMVARDMYLEEFGGDMDIRVIDSKGYTIAYGYALVRAREAINSGAQFDDVVEIVYDHISRVEAVAAVYTLGQMRKSGRIGGAAGLMGELLGIKPVIRLCDGVVDVIEKVRGERALLAKLTECVGERIDREANQNDACFIIYGKVEPADIDFVEDYIKRDMGISNVRRVPFGCSITTNTGPNVIGIVYYGKKRG